MNGPDLGFHARLKNASRAAILDALERCLQHNGLDELTFAQVAQEAKVSERTVYRHFPTKDALLEACWAHVQQTLGIELSTRSWKDFVAKRPEAFAEMDRREQLLRAVMQSRQAHDARLRINSQRQAGILRLMK